MVISVFSLLLEGVDTKVLDDWWRTAGEADEDASLIEDIGDEEEWVSSIPRFETSLEVCW